MFNIIWVIYHIQKKESRCCSPFLYFMKLCRGYTAKPYVYTTRPICSFEADELRIKSVCRTCHMTLKVGKTYEKRRIIAAVFTPFFVIETKKF